MKQLKHWQDPVNGLLGVWLALSPWALQYVSHSTAMTNAVVVGVLLIAAALGLWMVVSPWLLGFQMQTHAMNAAVGTGLVVMALAAWTLATDKDYNGWMRGRMAH